MQDLLRVRDLTVRYRKSGAPWDVAVDRVSFRMAAGETLALMGESGSGKTSLALAMLGLLPQDAAEVSGSAEFEQTNLLMLDERAFSRIRGAKISLVFQEPGIALSPFLRIGDQIAEVVRAHRPWGWTRCRREARETLERLGLSSGDRIFSAYPHQLSGGQCQRVLLAQALACRPSLLIADEPTSHLDARSQAEFLLLLENLKKNSGISILLISHAPEISARLADRLLVMKSGRLIGQGTFTHLYRNPSQEYTRSLLRSPFPVHREQKAPAESPFEENYAR